MKTESLSGFKKVSKKEGKKTTLRSYICHSIKEDVECEQQSSEDRQTPQTHVFEEMLIAQEAALLKITTMLKIKQEPLTFEKIKVWNQRPPSSDHYRSGLEIWMQITLNSNEEELPISIYCHTHDDGKTYYCHYNSDPPKGPTFPERRREKHLVSSLFGTDRLW